MIIYKWSIDWYSAGLPPPGLLNTLIYMFLSPGALKSDTRIYSGQATIQVALLALALICVPWMLLPKPLILRAQNAKKVKAKMALESAEHVEEGNGVEHHEGKAAHHDDEEEDVSVANVTLGGF